MNEQIGSGNQDFDIDPLGEMNADISQNSEVPVVSDSGKKTYLIGAVLLLVMLFLFYKMFLSGDSAPPPPPPKAATQQTADGKIARSAYKVVSDKPQKARSNVQEIIAPPPPPPSSDVPIVPPPPVPPAPTPQITQQSYSLNPNTSGARSSASVPGLRPFSPSSVKSKGVSSGGAFKRLPSAEASAADLELQQRLSKPAFIGGGGAAFGPTPETLKEEQGLGAEEDEEDENFEPGESAAPNVRVTKVKNLESTILEGKMMDAVLETAINSDLEGVLRAVVSRDVYAEKGRAILVPKGSRLIGQYNTDIQRGQSRVFIIWSRVIRPDGIDIAIDSPTTDQMGRSGIPGFVDNKYLEIFSNSLLLSTITVGFAAAADAITGGEELTETETQGGSERVSGRVTDRATLDAVDVFKDTASSVVGDLISVSPTVTIDQGTLMKVFANKDIHFPKKFAEDIANSKE